MELNKIYNEDCLVGLQRLPDKCIDLVVTDPPYLVHSGNGGGMLDPNKNPGRKYIHQIDTISDGFSTEILDELCRVMKKINIYLFCSQTQIPILLDYFLKEKGCNWTLLSWHKSNPIPTCNNKYLNDTEYCLYFREKGCQ